MDLTLRERMDGRRRQAIGHTRAPRQASGARWPATRVLLVALDSGVADTAVGGGVALAAGLESDRFPRDVARRDAVLRLCAAGLAARHRGRRSAAVAGIMSVRDARRGGWLSAGAGVALAAWILGET